MHDLEELRHRLCEELEAYGTKEMTAGSLDVVDKLAHAVKNIDKIIAKGDYSYGKRTMRYSMAADDMASKLHDLEKRVDNIERM